MIDDGRMANQHRHRVQYFFRLAHDVRLAHHDEASEIRIGMGFNDASVLRYLIVSLIPATVTVPDLVPGLLREAILES
jgi:hypothetical protein